VNYCAGVEVAGGEARRREVDGARRARVKPIRRVDIVVRACAVRVTRRLPAPGRGRLRRIADNGVRAAVATSCCMEGP
jgi:hypothetical protein